MDRIDELLKENEELRANKHSATCAVGGINDIVSLHKTHGEKLIKILKAKS